MNEKQAILCVDDEVIILLSLVQELKRFFGGKYLYEKALDAEAALCTVRELAAENVRVMFIVSDWLMPGMKGDEFLEVIHREYPSIRAILITGQADEKALSRVRSNESVVAVFKKPWNPNDLIETIAHHSVDS